jgi:IS30 family transposase
VVHTRFWTDADRAKLRKLRGEGLTMDVIAVRLGRSVDSVSREANRLGCGAHRAPPNPKPKQIKRAGKTTLPNLA